jgi:hypothetical protein
VVFNEPVTVDAAKFFVKVNDTPYTSAAVNAPTNKILLDVQKRTDRTITNAVVVGGTNNTTWDLTMSVSATHWEILRLATNAIGAAQDLATDAGGFPAPNSLLQIPEFIVKNKVKRVKEGFESSAGLYINSNKISSVTDGGGGKMYENALKYLLGEYILVNGDIVTIVLDTNQTLNNNFPNWWTYPSPASNPNAIGVLGENDNNLYRVIVTTTGNTDITITNQQTSKAMFQTRNGVVFVVDEHVILQGSGDQGQPLVQMMDGATFILDGGELRGNLAGGADNLSGAVRIGGGNRGSYFIMNGGKITGNTAKLTGNTVNGAAGAVFVQQLGWIFINGGEISGNSLDVNGTNPGSGLAGGISGTTHNTNNQYHGNTSFYMTDGEISGNKVENTTAAVCGAGGVLVSGAFQKIGGTIYGADATDTTKRNTTNGLSGNKASAVFIANTTGKNSAATVRREDTAGPDVTLFVQSEKATKTGVAVNTVPDWATSFWD